MNARSPRDMSAARAEAPDVVIVGAGLAGLACGLEVAAAGLEPLLLEAGDEPGGRVRTDIVEGFLLDRGFQVLLTAYPEARRYLDYRALGLRPFTSGAIVRAGGRFHRVADPWRHPFAALASAFAPIGSLGDKWRIAAMRTRVKRMSLDEIAAAPAVPAIDALRQMGFSPLFIDRFLRPFFGGTFLDRNLETSSRVLDFHFKMFASGVAALPATGMGAITRQLAGRLGTSRIRCGVRVASVAPGRVTLASGQTISASAVVIAVPGPEAARLLGRGADASPGRWRKTTCAHYAAPEAPFASPTLVLDGDGRGPVNNVAIPSNVQPNYAPPGAALISTTVLGDADPDDEALDVVIRAQMREWFGGAPVSRWRLLRIDRIRHALPPQTPGHDLAARPATLARGLYRCGDHVIDGSINGALASGRIAVQEVIEEVRGESRQERETA